MDYELAKKLKEAGFKVGEHGDDARGCFRDVCVPTLEELIDACGERFEELNRIGHKGKKPRWICTTLPCEECGWLDSYSVGGDTSEEAVARLWLALHPLPTKTPTVE